MIINTTLLIFYDYFYPGYKAGGPIQSLTNLAIALEDNYNISVITSCHDLHDNTIYPNINVNQWNTVELIPGFKKIKVFYAKPQYLSISNLQNLLTEIQPDVVYLNGIYSFKFFISPLLALQKAHGHLSLVVCPRGMLQKGALGRKRLKKKLFLKTICLSGLLNKATWHATNEEELSDIKKYFPKNKGVKVAPNIPKKPFEKIVLPAKQQGTLRLVYLSLLAAKKNLLLILQMLERVEADITLDIYGPVKDADYWEKCKPYLEQLKQRVTYKGDIKPSKVQETFLQYDGFILLTKGENFGHALYESLSVGRPVITSHFTPWNHLDEKNAGWNIAINTPDEGVELLSVLSNKNNTEWKVYCENAYDVAINYYKNLDVINNYASLFNKNATGSKIPFSLQ